MLPFDLSVLLDMFTYARPAGSSVESAFINRFIAPLPGAVRDTFKNWHIQVGTDARPILWSSHTDTVHHIAQMQTVSHRGDTIALSNRSKRKHASCLGADDTTGVFLCHQMILAGVPGYYIFHAEEECGGNGSSDLSRSDFFDLENGRQFACAIALDRRGTADVITHQMGRCASQAFAGSLASVLNASDPLLAYRPDDTGVFTDTANYTDVIGECTNLSVGYDRAHGSKETQDVAHLARLYTALCSVRADQLETVRLPGDIDPEDRAWSTGVLLNWPDDGKSDADRRLETECAHCELYYDPYRSDADRIYTFCSADCEAVHFDRLNRLDDRSIYLRPEYGDVQSLLRRQK